MSSLDTSHAAGHGLQAMALRLTGLLPARLGERIRNMLLEANDLGSVLRGAASVLAIRVAGAGITFMSMVLLARWMGAFEFGIYAYVWTWVILLGTMAPLGLNTSVLRFIPEYVARRRWRRLWGLLARANLIVLGSGLVVGAAAALTLLLLEPVIDAYYVMPFAVALIALPIFAMADIQESAARAFGWVTLAYIIPYVVRPLMLLGGIGALVLAGLSPDAVTAMLAMTSACALGLALQASILFRGIRRTVPRARPRYHAAYWLRISMPMLVFEGAYLLMSSTDVIMLGQIEDPASVAIYFAAARTASLIGFVYFAITARAVPKFSEINASGTRADLQAFLDGVNRMSFWPSIAGALALLSVGGYVLTLFGPGFDAGHIVLLILVMGYVARCTVGPLEYLLSMTGKQMVATWVICTSAALNLGLNALLIPEFGTMGAAIATLASLIANLAMLAIAVKRYLGLNAFLFRLSS
ncbi:oligosaccharide flippase family protein [Pyruvatibacter mobilis]|uniref:Oligosaccharide flippase family protein n=1 Tax=Pyruvatibacter mobilis TaxID=1712261 RepID=A0A845QCB9_9HYPH|nr:polysaccharide biosynthesis C-terminal domain-containing protein [Pyruvatibacter mobilis]NBG95856.1 oligosaccharide flippase family protein [Pyruvatibacter mobilis]QJD74993.1 oligosaccharide flippase family protein [Pyruvatibacter mobilis]GGD11917.1 polysaccharide biosynthesis protein [Pyruvatibacter mobilis]